MRKVEANHNALPPGTAAFVGRQAELDEIIRQASIAATHAKAVSIHAIAGMPGVGKSTLAVQVAHLLADQFPDRQLFVDLHAHTVGMEPTDPAVALAAMLAGDGLDPRQLPTGLDELAALWRARMAGRRTLLVLDNAAASSQIAPLLPGGAGSLVLVTSRRHLGDLPYAVTETFLDVLPPGDAVAMFLRLAPRAANNEEQVAELVTLAGCLPLAISLLARVYTKHRAWSMVDVAFITRLQLRLAYDVAVLYRVPLDPSDPDDMWKLIRVAFTIKGGEVAREGVAKIVPALLRPMIKRFYSGSVLTATKGLPFVGKYLLQRNVIKVGIPVVGVPLATVLNRYTTLLAGRHARAVFRNEARVVELAERLSKRSQHPQLMLWVAWLVITADHKVADDEALLIKHLVRLVRDEHQVVDGQFADLVDIDPAEVWRRLDAEPGDLSDLIDVAGQVATVDGAVNALETAVISELQDRCHRA